MADKSKKEETPKQEQTPGKEKIPEPDKGSRQESEPKQKEEQEEHSSPAETPGQPGESNDVAKDPHRGTADTLSQHKGLDPGAERNNDENDADNTQEEPPKDKQKET